jgi:hypothetical protein
MEPLIPFSLPTVAPSCSFCQLSGWQFALMAVFFAGIGALLKMLLDSLQGGWKKAIQVVSSAFWGGMTVILLSEWSGASPKTLLVLATLLGWLGFETTLNAVLKLLEKVVGTKVR